LFFRVFVPAYTAFTPSRRSLGSCHESFLHLSVKGLTATVFSGSMDRCECRPARPVDFLHKPRFQNSSTNPCGCATRSSLSSLQWTCAECIHPRPTTCKSCEKPSCFILFLFERRQPREKKVCVWMRTNNFVDNR